MALQRFSGLPGKAEVRLWARIDDLTLIPTASDFKVTLGDRMG